MSSYQHVRDSVENLVEGIIEEVYRRVRDGKRLSTSQLFDLTMLRLTLEILPYESDKLRTEVIEELYNSYIKKPSEAGMREWVFQPSKDGLLRILTARRRGLRVEDVIRDGSAEEVLSYIWLRSHRVLYKDKSGRLSVNKNISGRAIREAKAIGVKDVIKYLGEVPSRYWPSVLTNDFLKHVDDALLADLTRRFAGYNKSVDKRIMEEWSERALRGGLQLETLLSAKKLDKGLSTRIRGLNEEVFRHLDFRELENEPLATRWKTISSLYRVEKFRTRLSELSPITLAGLTSLEKLEGSARSKALLGLALRHYVDYMISGEQAERQLALYYAGKVDASQIDYSLRQLLESILGEDQRGFERVVSKLFPDDAIELLSMRVLDYASTKGFNYEVIERALRLSCRIFENAKKGSRVGGRVRSSRGRVDVRATVFNYSRLNYRLSFKDVLKRRTVTVLIDVSGSMLRYSIWTLIALASLIEVVDKILLFWDKVEVVKPPARKTRPLVYKFLEKLYTQKFKGYTNISQAIRVVKAKPTSRVVLIVSDLQQTVRDTEPWVEVSELIDRGVRVVVITPPRHDNEVLRKLKDAGCETIIVKNPSKLPILLKKRLNIKI